MSKAPIIFYSSLIVITVIGLTYSIISNNTLGIALMSFWCCLHILCLVFSIIDLRQRKKRLIKEAKKWFEQLGKEE